VIGVLAADAIPPTLTRYSEATLARLGTTRLIEINATVSSSIVEGDGRFWLDVSARDNKILTYDVHTGALVGAPIALHAEWGARIYAFGALWIAGDHKVLRIAPA
jgi:hypothetical protein